MEERERTGLDPDSVDVLRKELAAVRLQLERLIGVLDRFLDRLDDDEPPAASDDA